MSNVPHILVLRFSAMGDVAMIVPVLRALEEQHSNCKITVVSRAFFKPFFYTLNRTQFFSLDLENRHSGFLGIWRLFKDLKALDITHVADLHNVLRTKKLCFLFKTAGIKVVQLDKGRKEKRELTKAKNKTFKPIKPMVERHSSVFNQLGFTIDLKQPTFPVKKDLPFKIKNIAGEKTGRWIGIAPFAQYSGKVYPFDKMQGVIGRLSLKAADTIFLFGGGEAEKTKLFQLKNQYPNVIVVAGKLDLNEEMQLISQLDVMLSMDSGNGHIAAMLGVKVITLWGATHPYLGFTPFNQPEENSIVADRNLFPKLPTSVYGNKEVKGYENAMRTISIDAICKKLL